MPGKPKERRSECPVSVALEVVGDRWSLLIVRDLMVRGLRTFREFERAGEGIASNILTDRLEKLEASGILESELDPGDARRVNYRLTEKGIDLAPVMLELLMWGARHEQTGMPCAAIEHMVKHRDALLAEVRRRWRERDATPVIPEFLAAASGRIVTQSKKGRHETNYDDTGYAAVSRRRGIRAERKQGRPR